MCLCINVHCMHLMHPHLLQGSVSAHKVQQQVRITLKVIESLTFNCSDASQLTDLNKMLKEVEEKFRSLLPHQDGILLRPAIVTHQAKKITKKYQKIHKCALQYSSLALNTTAANRRKDWHFNPRVGKKADRYKKVNKNCTPLVLILH